MDDGTKELTTEGYIYCFTNPSMSGLCKIGMTERTPTERLSEANISDTWRPPTLYQIEFAKKIRNPRQKEKTLHKLLTKYVERPNPKREFFRISPNDAFTFFEMWDGDLWDENEFLGDMDKFDEKESKSTSSQVKPKNKGCRDLKHCFKDGQQIRHYINKTSGYFYATIRSGEIQWIIEIDFTLSKIDKMRWDSLNQETTPLTTPTNFAKCQLLYVGRRGETINGWKNLEYEDEFGEWAKAADFMCSCGAVC